MRTVLKIALGLALGALLSEAQSPVAQENSPKEVVEHFCKTDAEGKRLTSEDQKEILALLYEQTPSTDQPEIVVVGNYVVRAQDIRGDTSQVFVEYNVWGRLDSSFRFARLAGLSENHPISIREYISLIRSAKHRELAGNGQWQDVGDVLQWRITTMPPSPHVSVTAAMRYVREMGLRSRNPAVKRNAQAAVADLSGLLHARFDQSTEAQQSPSAVLAQFVALQTEGRGLTAEGQKDLNALLVEPLAWSRDKIHIARDFAVSSAVLMGNRGDLYVQYIALGDLDPSLRFTNAVPGGVKVREGYSLALGNKYLLPRRGGKPAQELVGPNRWKIAAAPAEQWITVNTAIRYVSEMRDKTADQAVKQNADETLTKLKALQ